MNESANYDRVEFCNELSSVISSLVALEVLEGEPSSVSKSLHQVNAIIAKCIDLVKPKEGWRDIVSVPVPDIKAAIGKLKSIRQSAEQFDDKDLGLTQDVSQQIKQNLEWAIEFLESLSID